jgi:NAD(P)-dependent dehydrogenase (short-subunit alcohol dehydrogenase family)
MGKRYHLLDATSEAGACIIGEDQTRQGMLDGSPLARFASTWDNANAILFLSSAESDFITGPQIVVDGGFSLKAG